MHNLCSEKCSKSPTKRHVPYEDDEARTYYCKYCGLSKHHIYNMSGTCGRSPTKRHIPF